jgi:nucleoside-diphosphate-sugar epimerase
LRIYDTYGATDERKKLMWLLKDLKLTQREVNMPEGKQLMNLVYIDDVLNAFILAGEMLLKSLSICEIYGVYSDETYSLREVVQLFEKVHNCKLNMNWGKNPYRTREVMTPIYFYPRLPGWNPTISLENGLRLLNG